MDGEIGSLIGASITKLTNVPDAYEDELVNELVRTLKNNIEVFNSMFDQCNQMTLKDYNALRDTIAQLAQDRNKWFYIGHTNRLHHLQQYYLWTTEPDNQKFDNAKAGNNLVKSHTYYTHLQLLQGQHKTALVQLHQQNPRCLNAAHPENTSLDGIVYVLVYTNF